MFLRTRSNVRTADAQDRSSTGTTYAPLVPVDDVDPRGLRGEDFSARRGGAALWPDRLPTSIELVRRLEACVHQLIEISVKER
jgi:hypothetical protein